MEITDIDSDIFDLLADVLSNLEPIHIFIIIIIILILRHLSKLSDEKITLAHNILKTTFKFLLCLLNKEYTEKKAKDKDGDKDGGKGSKDSTSEK